MEDHACTLNCSVHYSSLLQILVCVSVNLTVVYAMMTYSVVKKTDVTGILVRYIHVYYNECSKYSTVYNAMQANMDASSQYGWPSARTILVYSIAWYVNGSQLYIYTSLNKY